MQKIATRIFVVASAAFGVFGICLVLSLPSANNLPEPAITVVFQKLLVSSGFVVLSSFALSVAGKYLKSGK